MRRHPALRTSSAPIRSKGVVILVLVTLISGCMEEWHRSSKPAGLVLFPWKETNEPLGYEFARGPEPQSEEAKTFRQSFDGGINIGCWAGVETVWLEIRAWRQAANENSSAYEAVTPWFRWEHLVCLDYYNLTLHQNHEFQLTRIEVYDHRETNERREVAVEVIPVASKR